jgi:hypothetical protein
LLKPLGLVYTNNLTSGGKNGGTGLIPSPWVSLLFFQFTFCSGTEI